jgi:hypothetical protein
MSTASIFFHGFSQMEVSQWPSQSASLTAYSNLSGLTLNSLSCSLVNMVRSSAICSSQEWEKAQSHQCRHLRLQHHRRYFP